MKMRFKPVNDHVLLKAIPEERKDTGGLILPEERSGAIKESEWEVVENSTARGFFSGDIVFVKLIYVNPVPERYNPDNDLWYTHVKFIFGKAVKAKK